MAHRDKRDRGQGNALLLCVLAVVLPVAYVLSTGPFYWALRQGYVSDSVEAIYAPIALLAMFCPPLQNVMDRYVDLEIWR